jgi:hypothetical protein
VWWKCDYQIPEDQIIVVQPLHMVKVKVKLSLCQTMKIYPVLN